MTHRYVVTSRYKAAMANRGWNQPFFTRTYVSQASRRSPNEVLDQIWPEKSEARERSKSPTP